MSGKIISRVWERQAKASSNQWAQMQREVDRVRRYLEMRQFAKSAKQTVAGPAVGERKRPWWKFWR